MADAVVHRRGSRFNDISGQRYGRLVALEPVSQGQGHTRWRCICDCGQELVTVGKSLWRGLTRSCGCLRKEVTGARASVDAVIHGETRQGKTSVEYHTWLGMRSRCLDPDCPGFENYGKRGITVCERWLFSFDNFLSDMGRRPSSKHSIDRIDNNLGYSPENCRWATLHEQCNNRRSNTIWEYGGQKLTTAQWARAVGLNVETLQSRLSRGWAFHEAIATPPRDTGRRAWKVR